MLGAGIASAGVGLGMGTRIVKRVQRRDFATAPFLVQCPGARCCVWDGAERGRAEALARAACGQWLASSRTDSL